MAKDRESGLLELTCKHCSASLFAEDIDLEKGLATCGHCSSVYDLAGSRNQRWQQEQRPAWLRNEVPLPEKFKVEQTPSSLAISWRWFTPTLIFMAFFCVAWDSFLVFWYSTAMTEDNVPWLMVVFPVAHVAVGVGLTYYVITGFLNRTDLLVDGQALRIRHGPLPWPGRADIPRTSIDQLYAKRKTRHTKNGVRHSYQLFAILDGGRRRKLLGGRLDELEQVLYIEQEIEALLGIRDRPVPGEVER